MMFLWCCEESVPLQTPVAGPTTPPGADLGVGEQHQEPAESERSLSAVVSGGEGLGSPTDEAAARQRRGRRRQRQRSPRRQPASVLNWTISR